MLVLAFAFLLIIHSQSEWCGENSIKYVTFNGLESNCKINGNECNIYQQNDIARVIRTSAGQYQIFFKSPFTRNNYGLFINSNINSGSYGWAQIGGNNDQSSAYFGIDKYYALVDSRKIGVYSSYSGVRTDSDYISVVATTDFFDMTMGIFNGRDMQTYLSNNIGSITADKPAPSTSYYTLTFVNPFPDANYIIGLSSNFYGTNGAAAGIYGNNIDQSSYYTIKTNEAKIETRRTTDIGIKEETTYLSTMFGYPQLKGIKNYNVKWITFNGVNGEIFSNEGVANIESLSNKKYKIHWTVPFQTNNYAVFGASNWWGSYASQITISGQVNNNVVEIQTPSMDRNQPNNKADYISVIAFEYIGDGTCKIPTNQPLCSTKHVITQDTNGILDKDLLTSASALKEKIFFFSIISNDKNLLKDDADFISIQFYPFKDVNYASYLEIIISGNKLEMYRVDPFHINNKYRMDSATVKQNKQLIPGDFWLEFNNNDDFITIGAGKTNQNTPLMSVAYSDFVGKNIDVAALRLSYETFKYVNIAYQGIIPFNFALYDHCKNVDELEEFVTSFGFFSTDSGTDGDVIVNVYVKNDIYSCTISNIEQNDDNICTNLHYKKYERCKHDEYKQFEGDIEYDYVFEIFVENNDYIIFNKLYLNDYII
eukprot:122294_1